MRIVAGRFRSRRLKVAPPPGTRPTSDRLRETLFNILGPRILESKFVDAYAGVGAIGIEALSRGAGEVVFIDRSPKAAEAIRANLDSLGVDAGCRVVTMEVARALKLEAGAFDIVYLDPPYSERESYLRALETLDGRDLVSSNGIVVAEHARREELPAVVGRLERVRVHPQGDSALSFFEQAGE